jgi:manganese-dependent inorganic pyrophosphatase
MSDLVYVSGHKNPDTDSVCAAISYSYLLNKTKKYNAVPVRLGEISRETEYILKRFNKDIPMLLKSVKQKVEDLDYDKVTVFSKELTLKTAWSLMKATNLKSAPVMDDQGKLLGLLSSTNIIQGYMDDWDSDILKKAHTPIENVVDTLAAKALYLNENLRRIQGTVHIVSMTTNGAMNYIEENDVAVIGGDRKEMIRHLADTKVGLIILTGQFDIDEEDLSYCRERGVSVISTPYNTFVTSQQIIQSIPVEYVMQKGGLTVFSTDDTVESLREVMSKTRYRSYPVVDLNGKVVGTISRYALINGDRKKIIQVDHNERGQAVDGIEEAEILEVIDHHRIADFQTVGPVYYRAEPLGCTCTIITKMFDEEGVDIPADIAGLMLGAIISDSLLFRSPTCTPYDKKTAYRLAKIAGVDPVEFGMDMFKAGTSLVGKSVEEIFNQDYKKFNIGDAKVGVAQVNTMDIEGFASYKKDMLAYMEKVCEENEFDFAMLLLTDVINATSEVFVAGDKPEYVEKAFNCHLVDSQANLPGIVSRKKQVVPAITNAIG